jgi:hypothetical protein
MEDLWLLLAVTIATRQLIAANNKADHTQALLKGWELHHPVLGSAELHVCCILCLLLHFRVCGDAAVWQQCVCHGMQGL